MKTKNLLFLLVLLHAGMTHAQTFPDDCWGYVNTLRDEWMRKICTVGLDTVYIVGESGLIARSTDRGETWDKQHIGTAHLNDVKFADSQIGFAVGESGTILKTIDAGDTWVQETGETSEHINALAFTDLNNLWAVGTKSLVLHSTDGGASWQKKDIVDVECTLNDIAFRGSLGYFVGDYGVVYKTEDKGADWEKQKIMQTTTPYQRLYNLNMAKSISRFQYNNEILYETSDNTSWKKHEVQMLDKCHFISDNVGYCCKYSPTSGNDFMIWMRKTMDYGASWLEEKIDYESIRKISSSASFGDSFYFDVKVINEKIGYVALGSSLLKKPAIDNQSVKTNQTPEGKIQIVRETPDKLLVEATNTMAGLELIDLSGNIVLAKNNKNGSSCISIDVSILQAGLYLVKIYFSDKKETVIKHLKY